MAAGCRRSVCARGGWAVAAMSVLALVLLGGTARAQLQKGAPWPAERADTRNSGRSAYAGPTRLPREHWRLIENDRPVPPLLVDREGVIYCAAGDAVSAIVPDGSVRWRRDGLTAPALVALAEDGRLWVRTGDPAVLALDVINGETKAVAPLPALPVSGQLGDNGVLYVVAGEQVVAIDPDGHPLWTSDPFPGRIFLPALDGDGRLLVPFSDGVTALSPEGGIVWEHSRNDLTGLAIAPDGTLRNTGQTHSVVQELGLVEALDGDGRYLWEGETPGVSGSPAAVDASGTAFVGSAITRDRWGDGALHAVDAEGGPVWSCALARDNGNTSLDAPVLDADGTLYVVVRDFDGTRLCAVSPEGEPLWELPGDFVAPTPGDRRQLYVLDGNALVALTDEPEKPQPTDDSGNTPEPLPGAKDGGTANEPPLVTCLDPIVATDPGSATAGVVPSTIASAVDPEGGLCVLDVTPAGPYPVGVTLVNVIATDADGARSTAAGTVTVEDREPPVLTCPNNLRVSQNALGGTRVTFSPSVQDNCAGAVVTSVPSSGALFPPGTTTVRCTATDASGNTSTGTFTVTVTAPQSSPRASVSGNVVLSGTPRALRPQLNLSVSSDRSGRVSGRLTYIDPAAGLTLRAVKLTALVVDGQRCRIFGQGTINGRGRQTFCVTVTDARQPGRPGPPDMASVELGSGYSAAGPVATGDLRVGK